MNTLATTYSRQERPGAAKITFINPGYLKRLRYSIENSDWDERIISYEKRANKICVWFIIASMLYFIPIFIEAVLK